LVSGKCEHYGWRLYAKSGAWRRLGYNDILFREKSHMPAFIVLLRAVNVGGTGKLPMTELKAMCVAAGFSKAQTYIASGNVVFETEPPQRSGRRLRRV